MYSISIPSSTSPLATQAKGTRMAHASISILQIEHRCCLPWTENGSAGVIPADFIKTKRFRKITSYITETNNDTTHTKKNEKKASAIHALHHSPCTTKHPSMEQPPAQSTRILLEWRSNVKQVHGRKWDAQLFRVESKRCYWPVWLPWWRG